MKSKRTHYDLLGVKPSVGSDEIKRAYRRLVKTSHPDARPPGATRQENNKATEAMMRLNEAYETLMSREKRAAYDALIGISRSIRTLSYSMKMTDEDGQRQRYMNKVFHPARSSISRVLSRYPKELRQLSLDIFDSELICEFEAYVDRVEHTLRQGAGMLSTNAHPRSLDAAVQMMRYSIAQAADGMEEMRRFCQNFDYDHLTMAENLFKIAADLSRQALALTRG